MTAVMPWAQSLIGAAEGPIPRYGSPEWADLPDTSRAKVAACVIAAEAWRTYWSPEEHERRLRTELEADWEDGIDEARWSPEIVAQVHRSANRPSFVDLCDRRGEHERAERARGHRRRLGLSVEDGTPLRVVRGG